MNKRISFKHVVHWMCTSSWCHTLGNKVVCSSSIPAYITCLRFATPTLVQWACHWSNPSDRKFSTFRAIGSTCWVAWPRCVVEIWKLFQHVCTLSAAFLVDLINLVETCPFTISVFYASQYCLIILTSIYSICLRTPLWFVSANSFLWFGCLNRRLKVGWVVIFVSKGKMTSCSNESTISSVIDSVGNTLDVVDTFSLTGWSCLPWRCCKCTPISVRLDLWNLEKICPSTIRFDIKVQFVLGQNLNIIKLVGIVDSSLLVDTLA